MITIKLLTAFAVAATMAGFTLQAAPLEEIALEDIDGNDTSLKAYAGKVRLVVNVASKCGYTRQYKPLEATYRKYKDRGFVVLGFPCNEFGGQEPGSAQDIKEFCSTEYDVSFPLFAKLKVKKGAEQHPLYAALTGANSPFPGEVKWNFGKFLIGRDGRILARFDSGDEPDSEKVSKAIEAALASQP